MAYRLMQVSEKAALAIHDKQLWRLHDAYLIPSNQNSEIFCK